jgi:beta-galactosidase
VATARTDGESTFVFIQNFSAQQQTITLPQGYQDCLSAASVSGSLVLTPGIAVLFAVRRNV